MRLLISFLLLAASALASIIVVGTPGPDLNNSVQAATRVLEIQDTSSESGCIAINGVGADITTCGLGPALPVFPGGDAKPQSQTRTVGSLGITAGSDLRIVFDAVEPSGDGITLEALRLILQNPTNGSLIFTADLAAPVVLASTLAGTGKSDLIFKLDAAQAAAMDLAVLGSGVPLASVRLGLYANASSSAGGPEAFYVGYAATFNPPQEIPEPATWLTMVVGLAAVTIARRRA